MSWRCGGWGASSGMNAVGRSGSSRWRCQNESRKAGRPSSTGSAPTDADERELAVAHDEQVSAARAVRLAEQLQRDPRALGAIAAAPERRGHDLLDRAAARAAERRRSEVRGGERVELRQRVDARRARLLQQLLVAAAERRGAAVAVLAGGKLAIVLDRRGVAGPDRDARARLVARRPGSGRGRRTAAGARMIASSRAAAADRSPSLASASASARPTSCDSTPKPSSRALRERAFAERPGLAQLGRARPGSRHTRRRAATSASIVDAFGAPPGAASDSPARRRRARTRGHG